MPALGTINSATNVEDHPPAAYLDTTHSPVALYDVDGDLVDSSGNGLDMSMGAGTAYYGPAPVTGNARSIFFQSSRAQRPSSDASLRLHGALTIEAVVFPSIVHTTTGILAAYAGGGETEAENIAYELALLSGNRIRFAQENGAGVDNLWDVSLHVPVGQWTHLAVTRDVAGTGANLYINGILRASTTLASAPTGGTSSVLHAGEFINGLAPYTGFMSSLKIIAAELNASQVLAEANRALPFELRP